MNYSNKSRVPSVEEIEHVMNSMWKNGTFLRSNNPNPNGDYQYVLPELAKKIAKKHPETGGFITYQEFQSNLN
jgi:hypothetical protein